MRTEDAPCSLRAIDAEALGERPLSEAERRALANDSETRRRFEEHRRRQAEFLQRFPSFESLSSATRASQRDSVRAGPRLRLAIVPLTAAAALAIVALLSHRQLDERQGNEGIKGTPAMPLDMAVVREDVARPFAGQAVREGDKLIFRSRLAVEYLSIFSLEASGRVQAIVIAQDKRQSLAVHLPPYAQISQGIEVDSYPGRERIVAVASATPLLAEHIAAWLRTSYAAMGPEKRATLALGPPPFPAQVATWLLEKDATP